jgi:hypothetical protein
LFPNKKERYHLLSYTKEHKKVQGKGFEPQFNIKKVYVSPVDAI